MERGRVRWELAQGRKSGVFQVIEVHEGEVLEIDESKNGKGRLQQTNIEWVDRGPQAPVFLVAAPLAFLYPLLDKTQLLHVRRKPGIHTEKPGKVCAIIVTDGHGSEEIKASDMVPSSTDPHAGRERAAVRKRQ